MQLVTKLNIKIKNGFLPHIINEIYKRKCFTRNITLLNKEDGFDLFDIEVMYSNFEKFNALIDKIAKYEITSRLFRPKIFLKKK